MSIYEEAHDIAKKTLSSQNSPLKISRVLLESESYWKIYGTGTPPITLFFGPGKIYRVIGKTVLKEDWFSTKSGEMGQINF